MDRRDFIKISSVLTAGSTVLTSCGKTTIGAVSQIIPNDQMVIGEERHLKSVCNGCGAGCGVEVRWVDGKAIKLEGAADHPVNQGRLCARGQAELQLLYNPDRIQAPRIGKADAKWDDAINALVEKLKATDPKQIAFLTPRMSGLRARVIDEFLARIGAPPRVEVEPLSEASVRHAQTDPDFSDCNYVLSFGAPLIEGGSSPVSQQRQLAHMRQGRPGRRGKLVQIESRYSLTAAYADEWIHVPPGTEGALALALSHAPRWDYERASGITGVPVARIQRIAREFNENKPAIAVIGGSAAGHANSAATADAVAALNGSLGHAGHGTRSLRDLGTPAVILVAGCNPLYVAPQAIHSGAYIVSFSPFPDETTEAAQIVLPNHTTLEASHESQTNAGTVVVKAAVEPLYQTREIVEVLLDVSTKLGKKPPQESWKEMLDTTFPEETPKVAQRSGEAWQPPIYDGNGEFHLQIYSGVALGIGDVANVPWLQELPDPLAQQVWTTAVQMNPKTAASKGFADGDRVVVESPHGRVEARLVINPSCAPNLVAMAAGQGHTALGRYAKGRGANAFALVDYEHWAATKVAVRKA